MIGAKRPMNPALDLLRRLVRGHASTEQFPAHGTRWIEEVPLRKGEDETIDRALLRIPDPTDPGEGLWYVITVQPDKGEQEQKKT